MQSLLASVLKEADGKSDEEIRAMVLQQIRDRPGNYGLPGSSEFTLSS